MKIPSMSNNARNWAMVIMAAVVVSMVFVGNSQFQKAQTSKVEQNFQILQKLLAAVGEATDAEFGDFGFDENQFFLDIGVIPPPPPVIIAGPPPIDLFAFAQDLVPDSLNGRVVTTDDRNDAGETVDTFGETTVIAVITDQPEDLSADPPLINFLNPAIIDKIMIENGEDENKKIRVQIGFCVDNVKAGADGFFGTSDDFCDDLAVADNVPENIGANNNNTGFIEFKIADIVVELADSDLDGDGIATVVTCDQVATDTGTEPGGDFANKDCATVGALSVAVDADGGGETATIVHEFGAIPTNPGALILARVTDGQDTDGDGDLDIPNPAVETHKIWIGLSRVGQGSGLAFDNFGGFGFGAAELTCHQFKVFETTNFTTFTPSNGAQVVITEQASGFPKSGTTNANGLIVFDNIPSGFYIRDFFSADGTKFGFFDSTSPAPPPDNFLDGVDSDGVGGDNNIAEPVNDVDGGGNDLLNVTDVVLGAGIDCNTDVVIISGQGFFEGP